MNEQIANLIHDGVLIKLLLAFVLGGAVGLERELKGRAAGLRTHVLVALGATILIIAARRSGEMSGAIPDARLVIDPSRMAAGIVTGIGFLGAGAILRMGDMVRGITTAACIWFVASVGIVIGNGMYAIAIVSTIAVLIVLVVFNILEHRIPVVLYRSVVVSVPAAARQEFTTWMRETLDQRRIHLFETLAHVDTTRGVAEVTFRIRARGGYPLRELIEEVSARKEVASVELEAL